MLGLPKSTEFNKRIPKQKFYENMTVTPELKRLMIEQVKIIYWRNKIATTTINLAPGKDVEEIEVFEIRLNQKGLDEKVLRQIDKEIPYHIMFLLEYEGQYQAVISYKEVAADGNRANKIVRYYYSEWMPIDEMQVQVSGTSMDSAYAGYVRVIAGDQFSSEKAESIKVSVESAERRREIETQIKKLQTKMRREKQFNRQIEMNAKVKELRRLLDE